MKRSDDLEYLKRERVIGEAERGPRMPKSQVADLEKKELAPKLSAQNLQWNSVAPCFRQASSTVMKHGNM